MKTVFITILFFLSVNAFAQQGLQMDFGEIDSTELEVHRRMEYQQLIKGTFNDQFLLQELKLPEFSTQNNFHIPYNFGIGIAPQSNYMGLYTDIFTGAYMYNTEILSQAAYRLGDKFVVGGFSYGGNHIMSAPLPNKQGSYFDTYGSTMFMKYKVSKNVSIETSISVGQNRAPGFLP